jgi:Zn-dependent M28 family amino/carboxypeptidase
MSGSEIWHGADDNGSGSVGVVALAGAFAANAKAKSGLPTKRSLLFVVFAAEERGLLGAFYLAAHPLRPLETTRAMINFDMIGRNETPSDQTQGLLEIPADTTNRLNLIGALYSPDYQRTVVEQNKQVGLVLDDRFDRESALNVFFRSDQFPFVLKNVPAFWWFTGFHPDYHHTTDTADKINYLKMAKILRLAYLSGYQFANQAVPPRFVANPGSRASTR